MEMEASVDLNKLPELKLDARQAQGFISFFKTLPQETRAVRFFDRKDYYTVHGENALFIAKTYYHTTTALRQLGSSADSIYSVSVSKNMFETIARDILLERFDHTLELYEGSGSNWRLSKAGTPGIIGSFDQVLFANNDMQDSPAVVALWLGIRENQYIIGLSYVDLNKRALGLAEFLDDSQFTHLDSALVALGCKECLLPEESKKSKETSALRGVLSKCGILLTERKKHEFKSRDLVQDLGRIIRGPIEPVRDLLSEFEYALGTLGALLSYTDLLRDESNYRNYSIQKYNLESYMRLDSAAIKALNIFESKMDANKNCSLFGLMNRTCTAGMGKRLLSRWLKQPLLDISEINKRLDLVQAFVEDAELRQGLRQQLKRICDIERLIRSLRKTANLQPIVKLYQSCIRLPHIRDILEHYEGQFSDLIRQKYLDSLDDLLDDSHLPKFNRLIEHAIDLEGLENGQYVISSCFDNSLVELKNALDGVDEQIKSLHRDVANDLDVLAEKVLKLEKAAQFGHVFRISKKEEQKVRKKLTAHFIVLETRKDGVKFTNTKLKKLGNEYQKVFEKYLICQKELVTRLVDTVSTFSELFETLAGILSELDVLLGFADLAVCSPVPYTRPDITPPNEGDIILEGSRHPCVEAQDNVNFIPNDCYLVRGESWFQIITGPNMGGKSTYIRQVGVNVLMALVGSFIPCDKATISVRDCIFARVGAGDCQLRGVSTFMQEMLETASILKGATSKSLIIIDELGRGTSTYDGFGLAWAICEHLVEVIMAPTLFATHFHELTALARGGIDGNDQSCLVNGIANYHVGAHIDQSSRRLTMLYKVEPGACDQSFGIHVAEFANFPESVIALARAKAAELEDFDSVKSEALETGLESKEVVSTGEATQGSIKCKYTFSADEASQPSTKRKNIFNADEFSQGSTRARRFLEEFSSLPLDTMDPREALQQVQKLRTGLEEDASSYPWLQQFF